jgi:hypothetical protein
MSEDGGAKTREPQRQSVQPQQQQQPVQIGTDREPQGATWEPYARGGVAAPPIVPHTFLRTVDAPRGIAAPRADFVRHLQRTHGNQATIRHLQTVTNPAQATGVDRQSYRPAPLGPAPTQRSAAEPTTGTGKPIQRESWLEEGAMYLFEQGLAAAGVPVEAIMGLLRRAGGALSKIIDDPGAFLTHLLDALKGGFRQFAGNIGKHLQAGLIGWLTGALGGAGIQLPKQFDLAGIFDLALQILGLTADRIKAKVGQVIGAQNVRRIEAAWNIISKLISGGLGGLWDMAKEYVGNLYDMVIGQVKDWAITQIVQQAVIKIISMFNPAGALVQVVQTIWNIIQFLRERGAQLFSVFQRIAESVAEIAEGNIGNAINAVENTLASAIAPLLGLLARLIGLGDIAERIKAIIEAIRAPIDKALDKVIAVIAKGLKGAIGALGKLVGGGGKPGAQEASAETKAAQEQRERQGVEAGVRAFNRFNGRPAGEQILRPLLTAIRLRYRLAVLEPVVQGDKWAVHGEIRRVVEPTEVLVPKGFDEEKWKGFKKAVRQVVRMARLPEGELLAHGSRVGGTPRENRRDPEGISDIDLMLRVDPSTFFEFAQERLAAAHPGTDFRDKLMRQVRSKKISKFYVARGFPGLLLNQTRPFWPHDIDFSVVEAGSPFDQGPYTSLERL